MKYSGLILLMVSLLSACQSTPVKLEDSPYATLPAGSTLVQHQDLILPSNTFSLQFQNGEQLHHKNIDQYYANCELESRDKASSPRTIKAGSYQITRSKRYHDYTALQPVKVAAVGIGFGTGFGSADVFTYVLSMDLQSSLNPSITRFTCTHWGTYEDDDYLTLNVIRDTLNPIFSIKLPGEK